MQNDIDQQHTTGRNNGKVIAGFILLMVGGLLLLQQIGNFILPFWFFSWGSLFLVIGLYSGAKNNFRKPISYVFIIIGSLSIMDDIFPDVNFRHLTWPIIIIAVGILLIMKRNQKWEPKNFGRKGRNRNNDDQTWKTDPQFDWDKKIDPTAPLTESDPEGAPINPDQPQNTGYAKTYKGYPAEDYLDATSIFGSANKTIFTKTFRGGEIVNIFGGAEIDFTQSDISGQVVIDVTQIFGGIKLLVPPHWHVTSDTVSLFAGFDDKRKQKTLNGDKVLMITGTSIFAGIEIRSY